MFTLQILDRGQTFLHSLDGAPVVLGRAGEADVQLGEAGVQPVHARIEPIDHGVRLVAIGPVLVNGQAVRATVLALGDRIEIGKAVLVVGRAVHRAAGPEDVLADGLPRTRASRTRTQGRARWWAITAAGIIVAVGLAFVFSGDDTGRVSGELAGVARLRQAGQLEQATAAIERLHRDWSDATDDRLDRLDAERQAVLAVETATTELTAQVLDPALSRSYAEWNRELQRLEAEGTPAERVAARRVRSSLRETLSQRPATSTPPDAVAAAAPPPTTAGSPTTASPTAAEPPARSSAEQVFVEAQRLVDQDLFTPALSLLQGELANATGEAGLVVVQRRIDDVRAEAKRKMATALEQAQRLVEAGKPEAAARLLAGLRHRFPATPEFAELPAQLAKCEALAAAAATAAQPASPVARPDGVDPAVRTATLAGLRAQMDQVRAAEERAAFGEAAGLLRAAADLVRDRDADFARRLEVRADEAGLLAAWHECIAETLRTGRVLNTTTAAGQGVQLRAVEGPALLGSSVDGDLRLCWHDIGAPGLQALTEQVQPTGRSLLGAATLLYKQGESERAEALLAKALRADATQKPLVDEVIAHGRGEPIDALGYTLGKDGFVSARSIEVQKQAKKLGARLDTVLRDKNPNARDAFVTDVLSSGPEALDVMVAAFQKEFGRQLEKLESGNLKKQVDRLAQQRVMLDAARKNARDLIYDEVKYFYPYKPPAVSGQRFAEYNEVQAEVDRRVAALRVLWRDDRVVVRVPASLRADLDRLQWVAKVLGDLGELDQDRLARVDWARALPAGDSVGIRDYCATVAERTELEEWRRIEAYNTIVGKKLGAAVREQLRITNDYRAMFRHRPLAIVASLCEAAQGHAEEMSKLGYFAHMSPTPGRTTPYDRMRLAGYKFGVSENIALSDSALASHNAWCQSSGHHRNLLDPNHHEVGIGADGRYWVQNFGSGLVHRDDPAWAAAGEAGHR
ncbi:MAG TPA: CAP domain-containing protein [Planctomycetota bacterium]|nr:CAP domain-containing protein [Planctomycetota bacterium]